MNYLITETQLESLMSVEKPVDYMPLRVALKKILSVLSNDGYEPEQIVDFMLGLRHKDEFTIRRAEKYKSDPEFMSAVKRVIE